jgi:hypothetical protein
MKTPLWSRIRDRLEVLPSWLLAIIDWPAYRLFGKCWADDCPVSSRRNLLHTPRQLHRCESTPMAIRLTDPGWLCAIGVDPRSTPEPVVPVSHAS